MYDEERVDVGIHSHKHLVCGVRCRLRLESVRVWYDAESCACEGNKGPKWYNL